MQSDRPKPGVGRGRAPAFRIQTNQGPSSNLQATTIMDMELELWPGLHRWVDAFKTTNRGVSSNHRSRTLLPYCLTTETGLRAKTLAKRLARCTPRDVDCPTNVHTRHPISTFLSPAPQRAPPVQEGDGYTMGRISTGVWA